MQQTVTHWFDGPDRVNKSLMFTGPEPKRFWPDIRSWDWTWVSPRLSWVNGTSQNREFCSEMLQLRFSLVLHQPMFVSTHTHTHARTESRDFQYLPRGGAASECESVQTRSNYKEQRRRRAVWGWWVFSYIYIIHSYYFTVSDCVFHWIPRDRCEHQVWNKGTSKD